MNAQTPLQGDHPAIVAYNMGQHRLISIGCDWKAYSVVVDKVPYVVTIWLNGSIVVQAT